MPSARQTALGPPAAPIARQTGLDGKRRRPSIMGESIRGSTTRKQYYLKRHDVCYGCVSPCRMPSCTECGAHPTCNIQKGGHLTAQVLSPAARVRWQQYRPEQLAQLDAYVLRPPA